MTGWKTGCWLILALLAGDAAAATDKDHRWRLDRVIMVMRHGVRPPTKPDPLPKTMVAQAWPGWDVGWGELTGHGAKAVGLLGESDRARYRALLGPGCPTVRVVADSDERTTHTASAYIARLLPGCAVSVEHGAPGVADPRFSPFDSPSPSVAPSPVTMDPALAAANAALPDGGTGELDQQLADDWRMIDAITGCTAAACRITARPTALSAAGGRAKLSGALALGASFAQTLALEYADGKPMAEVGWGRVTRAQITALSHLHATEFAITARPLPIASAGSHVLLGEVRAALVAPPSPRFSIFVGHDSNLSWLGGALGIHWHVPQFARDDPPPGGALIFERWTDGAGHFALRVLFRSQTLDEMRNLAPVTHAARPTTGFAVCSRTQACSLNELSDALVTAPK